ncbi:MAG: hypothetical protein Q7S55_03990 [Nanoarchaeota archaeon]|nr:hypothetical protein [Nanoarchaeota archaeon]
MAIPTDLISIVLIPLFSLSGLLAGIVLSHLAREESTVGKKYFILMYRIIFVSLSLSITYFLSFHISVSLVFLAFGLILLAIDFKKYFRSMFIIHYLFFLAGYFISGQQLIIAAILFLYGLPVGTLLRLKQ